MKNTTIDEGYLLDTVKIQMRDYKDTKLINVNKLDPDMPTQALRLHMGELTDDEVLVARAAIRWANSVMEETK